MILIHESKKIRKLSKLTHTVIFWLQDYNDQDQTIDSSTLLHYTDNMNRMFYFLAYCIRSDGHTQSQEDVIM